MEEWTIGNFVHWLWNNPHMLYAIVGAGIVILIFFLWSLRSKD